METLTILHTNDLHSHFENWPKIRRYLNDQHQGQTPDHTVFAVDLGDFVDRWHPLTEVSQGQANIQLMNEVHYQAATIGNNEGVGSSKEELNHLYDHADFPVLLDNLLDPETELPPHWAQPYRILTTQAGTKVGLLALTAPFPLTYEPNGWHILYPDEVLPEMVKRVRPKCDVLVLMSHLGIEEDRRIAKVYPEFDVILGSHTHHLFMQGELVEQTLLAAAGKFGQYIGKVDLELANHRIVTKKAAVIPTAELPACQEDDAEIAGYFAEGRRLLKEEQVADLPFVLSADLSQPHPAIEAALAAMQERAGVSAAILNSGLFLKDLPQGLVTHDDLHEALPHPMHLVRITLSGRDLLRFLEEVSKNRNFLKKFPIQGMGFRGKIFGEVRMTGMQYNRYTKQASFLGQPIEPEAEYQIVTVDHFVFIPFFPTLEIAGKIEFLFPEFIRTVLGDYLGKHYPIL